MTRHDKLKAALKSAIAELRCLKDTTRCETNPCGPCDTVDECSEALALLDEPEPEQAGDAGPPTSYHSNGEAGDGQVECDVCGHEDGHTWKECALESSKQAQATEERYWDMYGRLEEAEKQRDEAVRLLRDYPDIVDPVAVAANPVAHAMHLAQVKAAWGDARRSFLATIDAQAAKRGEG